jgi:hypothetical protein
VDDLKQMEGHAVLQRRRNNLALKGCSVHLSLVDPTQVMGTVDHENVVLSLHAAAAAALLTAVPASRSASSP